MVSAAHAKWSSLPGRRYNRRSVVHNLTTSTKDIDERIAIDSEVTSVESRLTEAVGRGWLAKREEKYDTIGRTQQTDERHPFVQDTPE